MEDLPVIPVPGIGCGAGSRSCLVPDRQLGVGQPVAGVPLAVPEHRPGPEPPRAVAVVGEQAVGELAQGVLVFEPVPSRVAVGPARELPQREVVRREDLLPRGRELQAEVVVDPGGAGLRADRAVVLDLTRG